MKNYDCDNISIKESFKQNLFLNEFWSYGFYCEYIEDLMYVLKNLYKQIKVKNNVMLNIYIL